MQTEDLQNVEKLFDETDGPDEPITAPGADDVTDGEYTEPIEGEVIVDPPHPPGIPIRWLLPIGAVSLALALVGVLIVLPLFAQSATISITPDVQTITAQGQVTLAATNLVSKTLTLSEQVTTTGSGHQDSTTAHGWVTFYNSLQSAQVVPAGTLLVGSDGSHVTTDEDAYIPAGTLATNGRVTVLAHTALAGTIGNIGAGDINGPCCRDYVFAYNSTFTGGQDAREYRTATVQDITGAAKELTALTTTQLTSQAATKLSVNQAMTTPQCHGMTTSTPQVGTPATQVTVSVTSSCNIYAYDSSAVSLQGQRLFNQLLYDQLGTGYGAKGVPSSTVTHTTFSKGMLTISLTLSGSVVYHFQAADVQAMQQLVAGKSREAATTLLLHVRGVRTVGIQIDNGRTTLPGDTRDIVVSVFEKG